MAEPSKKPFLSPEPSGDEKEKDILMREKDVWEKARAESSAVERKEETETGISPENKKLIKEQIEREVKAMDLVPELRAEAKKKAETMGFLGEQEKLNRLMSIAQERGLAFAFRVAKDMNDPFILDTLHDTMVKDEFYKNFEM